MCTDCDLRLARKVRLAQAERSSVLFDRGQLIPITFANNKETTMLYWAAVFLIVALVAGFFGFFGIAGAAVGIAKILFFVFLVLFIVSLLAGGFRRPLP